MIAHLLDALARDGSCSVAVRARPGARKTAIREVLSDGSIKIDLHAAPDDGAANAELIRFLAGCFGVPPSHVSLLSGQRARTKLIRIDRPRTA